MWRLRPSSYRKSELSGKILIDSNTHNQLSLMAVEEPEQATRGTNWLLSLDKVETREELQVQYHRKTLP